MFKRILVPTDGSETAAVGMRYAIALAKKHKAAIAGLHVVDVKLLEGPFLRDLSASLGTAPYVNYQGNIAMLLDERGKAALTALTDACEEDGVACSTTQVTGIVPRAIVDNGELTDLIVMGRGGEHDPWLEGLLGSTTEAVVRRSSRPVLVTGTDVPGNTRFLVAYDGSHHSRSALKAAVTIGTHWGMPCELLVVGGPESEEILAEAKDYMQAYDFELNCVRRDGDPDETIILHAQECQADLLVMGAYGHSKVREVVLGSTTAYAINHAPCPVLLAR